MSFVVLWLGRTRESLLGSEALVQGHLRLQRLHLLDNLCSSLLLISSGKLNSSSPSTKKTLQQHWQQVIHELNWRESILRPWWYSSEALGLAGLYEHPWWLGLVTLISRSWDWGWDSGHELWANGNCLRSHNRSRVRRDESQLTHNQRIQGSGGGCDWVWGDRYYGYRHKPDINPEWNLMGRFLCWSYKHLKLQTQFWQHPIEAHPPGTSIVHWPRPQTRCFSHCRNWYIFVW